MLSHKRNAKTRDAKTRDAKTRDSNSHKNNRTKWKANWKLTDFFHLHATENRSILLQLQFFQLKQCLHLSFLSASQIVELEHP